jgi:hypothetical protein
MWQRYGYLLATRVDAAAGGAGGVRRYSGVSRSELWPIVDDTYWTVPDDLPPDVQALYGLIERDPDDFLFLRVTRSLDLLWKFADFIESSGESAPEALAIEIDTDEPLPFCDDIAVKWLGYEPYARGEWGLLSLLEPTEVLRRWTAEVNEHGLLPSPEKCLAFSTDYKRTMGHRGGPESIADDATIDILRVGLIGQRSDDEPRPDRP